MTVPSAVDGWMLLPVDTGTSRSVPLAWRNGQIVAGSRTGSFGQAGDTPFVIRHPDGNHRFGVWRNGAVCIDWNGNYQWDGPGVDRVGNFGQPGDKLLIGNWTDRTKQVFAVWRDGQLFIDTNDNLQWDGGIDQTGYFGQSGDVLLPARWAGNGYSQIAVRRGADIFVDADGSLTWSAGDQSGSFGLPTDVPLPLSGASVDW